MVGPTFLLALVSAVSVSVSAAAVDLQRKATCVYHCGSICYWQSDIDAALAKGYSLYKSGSTLGSDKYPHQYNDLEGFSFPTASPWYEFPILSSYSVYSGGSPGPDRVIFDSKGNFDSLITHTGASGNNFKACTKG
ncbi:ribonuclease-domain-containing protein [Coniochaeta sp. PMI_546]|nr:ribonuclease-domain-containing protein [Coniochaeta sp. PMI_546]